MSSIYQLSFSDFNLPGLESVFRSIIKVSQKFDLQFFLIGALARDIILEKIHNRQIYRATKDIDVAITLSDWNQFEKFFDEFMVSEGFERAKEAQRLIYDNELIVDIIPFGEIDLPDNQISWPPDYSTILSTLGFREVYENTIIVKFDNELTLNVASLEGLTILKIIAWDDRNEVSKKDALDIAIILKSYFDVNYEEIYESFFYLIEAPNFDYLKCGARVLGMKMDKILDDSTRLKSKIIQILEKETRDMENSKLAMAMRNSFETIGDYRLNFELINELLRGLKRL